MFYYQFWMQSRSLLVRACYRGLLRATLQYQKVPARVPNPKRVRLDGGSLPGPHRVGGWQLAVGDGQRSSLWGQTVQRVGVLCPLRPRSHLDLRARCGPCTSCTGTPRTPPCHPQPRNAITGRVVAPTR